MNKSAKVEAVSFQVLPEHGAVFCDTCRESLSMDVESLYLFMQVLFYAEQLSEHARTTHGIPNPKTITVTERRWELNLPLFFKVIISNHKGENES